MRWSMAYKTLVKIGSLNPDDFNTYEDYQKQFEDSTEKMIKIVEREYGKYDKLSWNLPTILWKNNRGEYSVDDFGEIVDVFSDKNGVDLIRLENGNLGLQGFNGQGIAEFIAGNPTEETVSKYIPSEDADDRYWESMNMHRKNKVNEIWALQDGELVEIDDEPTDGITVSADDFGGNIKDVVDIYLHWNGVIGYTDRIYGIWEDTGSIDKVKAYCDYEGIGDLYDLDDALRGEVYIRDMDQDDFTKLKRQLGIYESVRKPMRRRLKENEIGRYSDAVPYEQRRYWYWTKHGLGPGTLPKGVNVLDAKEGQNQKGTWGVFVLLDAVLNSNELREYDIIELAPGPSFNCLDSFSDSFSISQAVPIRLPSISSPSSSYCHS